MPIYAVNCTTESAIYVMELIDEKSTGWKTNRMAKVDLAIIRLAVYEIKFEDDIPTKVSIS